MRAPASLPRSVAASGHSRRAPHAARPFTVLFLGTLMLIAAIWTIPLTLAHPEQVGASPVHAEGAPASLDCQTVNTVASLAVVAPSSASGIVGSSVTVEGSGFSTVGDVFVYFSPAQGSLVRELGSVAPGTAEPFEVTYVVPDGYLDDSLGVSEFWGLDSSSNCASAAFTVTAVPPGLAYCVSFSARLTLDSPIPASGPAGTSVTLSGQGFYPMGSTNFWWSSPNGSASFSAEVGSTSGRRSPPR